MRSDCITSWRIRAQTTRAPEHSLIGSNVVSYDMIRLLIVFDFRSHGSGGSVEIWLLVWKHSFSLCRNIDQQAPPLSRSSVVRMVINTNMCTKNFTCNFMYAHAALILVEEHCLPGRHNINVVMLPYLQALVLWLRKCYHSLERMHIRSCLTQKFRSTSHKFS